MKRSIIEIIVVFGLATGAVYSMVNMPAHNTHYVLDHQRISYSGTVLKTNLTATENYLFLIMICTLEILKTDNLTVTVNSFRIKIGNIRECFVPGYRMEKGL